MTPASLGLPPRFTAWRPGQLEMAMDVAASDTRFDLLTAPTGSGKTAGYMGAAAMTGARGLVLVGTKQLGDQVAREFGPMGLVEVKGHSAYPCWRATGDDRKASLRPANLVRADSGDSPCDRVDCYWQRAVAAARQAPYMTTTYANWMTLDRMLRPTLLGDFDLLIADEAHGAEGWLQRFCEWEVDAVDVRRLVDMALPTPEDDFIEWVGEALVASRAEWKRIRDEGKEDPRLDELRTLGRNLRWLLEYPDVEWIVQGTATGIRLSPVWAGAFANARLWRGIPRVVGVSATLTEADARYLNLRDGDYTYHEVGRGFDPRRRPVYVVPAPRMDARRTTEADRRRWALTIDRILEGRPDVKGIVQPMSYERGRDYARRSRQADRLMLHEPRTTAETVKRFRATSAAAVLVSPAVGEGVDFAGSAARFNVIAKLPFPDTRDVVMKARCDADKGYRSHLARRMMMQQAGRIVRSADDWGETIVVDGHATWFLKPAGYPKWFTDAVKWVRRVPEAMKMETEVTR